MKYKKLKKKYKRKKKILIRKDNEARNFVHYAKILYLYIVQFVNFVINMNFN